MEQKYISVKGAEGNVNVIKECARFIRGGV